MSEVTVEAVVLRRRDSGESDRRLTLFSRELGKLDAVAKGARKATSRLSGVSDPMVVARFTFAAGKRNRFITQAAPVSSFRGLRADYDRLRLGLCLLELADAVLPYDLPDEDAYEVILAALQQLDSHPKVAVAWVWAQLKLLEVSGFLPQFLECAVTGVPLGEAQAWFSPAGGGYLCPAAAASQNERELVAAEVLIGLGKTAELAAPPPNLRQVEGAQAVLFRIWRSVVSMPLPANEAMHLEAGAANRQR